MINSYLIGADPEFFLTKEGNPLSAIGLLGAAKENPKDIGKGCAVLEDNVMVEFNTPPTDSPDQMVESIDHVFSYVKKVANEKHGNVEFSNKSALIFDANQLKSKEARRFGCDPDMNAYDEFYNDPPSADMNIRYAGGHIHISYQTDNMIDDGFKLIKYLDLTLGIPMVVVDRGGAERRSLYGKAGTFRIKNYGVEYRSPSNFWIFKEDNVNFVFESVSKAITLFNNSYEIKHDIRKIIDTDNVEEATKLSKQLSLL